MNASSTPVYTQKRSIAEATRTVETYSSEVGKKADQKVFTGGTEYHTKYWL